MGLSVIVPLSSEDGNRHARPQCPQQGHQCWPESRSCRVSWQEPEGTRSCGPTTCTHTLPHTHTRSYNTRAHMGARAPLPCIHIPLHMHIRVYAHTGWAHTYTPLHTCTRPDAHRCMLTRNVTHTCSRVHTQAHTHTRAHTFSHAHALSYTCIHIHAHMCTPTHRLTATHIHTRVSTHM